jgi:hypothetical protein
MRPNALFFFPVLVVGSLAASTPALACGGSGKTAMAPASPSAAEVPVVLTGALAKEGCPVEAKGLGCTGHVLVTVDSRGAQAKYMIVASEAAERMLRQAKAGQAVEVTGTVVRRDDRLVLEVRDHRPAVLKS